MPNMHKLSFSSARKHIHSLTLITNRDDTIFEQAFRERSMDVLFCSSFDVRKMFLLRALAKKSEIKTDFETVKKQTANRKAIIYKKHTKLTLPVTEIDKLTNKHIDSFEKELKRIYTDFDTYPSDVRLALFDLIFNLGMTKLKNNWPNFNTAIKAEDWGKAASNSNRKSPISDERNKYVKDLLEKSAKEKKAKSGE